MVIRILANILLFFISSPELYPQTYSIQQYLNIRGASSPQYSFDDKKIYFIQSVTGSSQIWMLKEPAGWPFQITFYSDRITAYSVNPSKDLIFFSKDEGGSEYSQFFLASGDGTNVKMLTGNEPKVLYGFGRWSDDGKFFTYYSNKRSPYFYDIYIYDLTENSHKMVYSSDHSNYPSVISPDGKKMIISRSYNTYDNDLYILDIATGVLKLLTLHDNLNEPSEFYAYSFSKKGDKVFITTNYKNDFFRIALIDLNTGKIDYPVYDFLSAYQNMDVSSLFFSPDKNKMCVLINDRGYDRLFVYNLKGNFLYEIPDEIQSSSITALRFSNNSDRLIVGINSAKNPSVLYEWNLENKTMVQLTFPSLAGIDPKTFLEPELITFKSFDGLEIQAFYYKPYNAEKGKKFPCIISIHGGPESQAVYGFDPIFQYFLNSGYAVIEPNVRGSTGYGKKFAAMDNVYFRENAVKDIASLRDYLVATGEIDENKIAVMGASYGGYMVLACLTLYPELFAAGVDIVGISNFVTFLRNTADYRRSNRESEYGSLERDYDFLQSISPINRVENIKAPLMIIHGRNDPRVPVSEAEQMYDAVIKGGGVAELIIYEDEGHSISKLKNRLDLYPKIVNFLDRYVRNK
ncbi:MAG: S9 family peptidase [Ignavibacteria bacterium]|nr:S9 family peptidase [Ignavibacteria bacterium]